MSRVALRTAPAEAPAPEAPPVVDLGRPDELPWLGPIGLMVVSALILVVAERYIRSQLPWLQPLFKDLRRWLRDPMIAGGWSAPARPLLGLAVFGLAGAIGIAGARLLVRGSRLSGEPFLVAGLGLTLGVCVLGYVGMLGVAFGLLSAPWLAGFLALVAVAVWLTTARRRRPDAVDEVVDLSGSEAGAAGRPTRPRVLLALTALLAVMVVGLMALHASLTPVQEWDAIVYHAASAKNWFEDRPSPPIVYGPSVGVEISGNYPPLFPAAGAAVYTLIGRFDDLYLRILPPLLFAAILLMTFGYGRRRFGDRSACFAVLLLLGTPLLVMYGVWPTGYILLAAALLATVILLDLAVSSGSRWHWAAAGLVGGLAVLSHVYGFMAVAVAICAVLVARRRRIGNLAVFLLAAGVVAAPWLLRNLVLLHDPFYPLGSPPFHGIGLVQPIWDASKAEVKNAALGFWQVPSGSSLRLAEVTTALFDRNLLPLGLYFGLVLGLAQIRRNRAMALVALSLVAVLAAVIAPGWYWLRGLVPALPLAALLTGRGLDLLVRSGRRVRMRGGRLPSLVVRSATVVAVTVPLVAGGVVGLAIASVGPNGHTWTTSMSGEDDFAASIRSFGDPRQTLWNVFTGDTLLWAWMNALPAGERVATLEVRTYYLDRPHDLFYLDGLEAAPLLELRDPAAIERFLRSEGVRYVMLPQWAADGRTSHPVTRILPMFRVLGTDRFPLVGAFAIGGSEVPSRVFSVGPPTLPLVAGVYPGVGLRAPAPVDPTYTIPAGGLDARIFAPLPSTGPSALAFDYDRHGVGKFSINDFKRGDAQWNLDYLQGRGGGTGWASAVVPLPAAGSYADFGIFVRQGALRIRNVRVVPLVDPTVLMDGSGAVSVASKGDPVVVGVPVTGGRVSMSFSWRGAGRVSLHVRGDDDRWSRIPARVGPPPGAGGWRTATVTVRSGRARAVQVRIVADGGDVTVRDIRLNAPNTSSERSAA